ncbi:MAG: hydrolase [Deltaproteobacteria bacterium]|nr:hydrolase [Deltaproteobacteria bacterium]
MRSVGRTARFGLAILLALALASCVTPRPGAEIAIEGVTVVDAMSGVRENQRVVTRGDRIVWVGSMGEGGPVSKRVIDGRGRFLIPGLWDAHVHFLYDLELTESMASLFLAYGVTSVRDTGGDLAQLFGIRDGWQRDGIVAPRLFVSGPLLDGAFVVYDGATAAQPELGTSVPDTEAARAKVRWLHSMGADFIKIYELVSPAVFRALVEEANALGMPIASHVPLSLTADVAGPATGSMEHLRNIELACASDWRALLNDRRALLQAFDEGRGYELRRGLHSSQRLPAIAAYDADRCREVLSSLEGTMQVPTLRLNAFNRSRPDRNPEWQAATRALPTSVRRRWQGVVERLDEGEARSDMTFADWSLFLVGEMRDQGVPIAAGTDTPIRLAIPGESLHRELELLVRSGLSTREALFAATVAPARFFSLESEMGQIAEGMRADLVLLGANPLVDIRNTRRIEGVMSRGLWLPRSIR